MTASPAPAGRPRFDFADVVRAHRAELESRHPLTVAERRVLSAIALCRTAALGGHVDTCRSCGYEHPAYNSCRNRHCTKCQALAQERWIRARSARLLPVGHFHVVFTLPAELRPLARFAPAAIYNALFAAASDTLVELARDHLGATLGITMVLHTWTRDLRLHPHVHAIVTAGGLALDGQSWIARPKFLFHVDVMGELLRGKMLDALRRLRHRGAFDGFDDFDHPQAFDLLMAKLANHRKWVVYAKEPFRRSSYVLDYLGRYTHRVGFASSRILAVTDTEVTFRTKGEHSVTLPAVELLRRFLLHILPDGFQKIRHYGLYAGAAVGSKLAVARKLLDANPVEAPPRARRELTPEPDWQDLLHELTGRDVRRCPNCGGLLERRTVARAPPAKECA